MYLRGCARSRGRLSRSTASRDQDWVSGEGSSVVTGVTSPTPSVKTFEFSSNDLIFFI